MSRTGSLFDDAARVHHRDAIGGFGDDAEVVRDQQQREVELFLHIAQQLEDLRLHGDVERGGRLVGDDERRPARQGDGNHHALPHAARQLMRVVVHALVGIGDSHRAQQIDRALRAPPACRPGRARAALSPICAPTRITGFSAAIGS